ncbi:hypothetical protein HDK90DRAFT_492175, partial [Phyllosticta capitalensis]
MAPPVDPLPDQHSIEHALARYVEENSFLEQVNKFEIQLVRSEQLAYESNTGCQLKFSSIADRHVQAISSRDIMVQIINGRKHARQGTEPTVETILESQREDLHVSAVDAGVARLEDLITAWKEIPSEDFFKTKRQASCRFKDSAAAFRQRSKAFLDDQRERILTVSGVPYSTRNSPWPRRLSRTLTLKPRSWFPSCTRWWHRWSKRSIEWKKSWSSIRFEL